jgi:DNA-directed RNA polymerase subunit RPC12/RpoP
MSSGKITIWVGKELHEACKKLNINMSVMFREWLKEKLREANIEVKTPETDFVFIVKCIHCGTHFATSCISQVRCLNCKKTFRVFVKEGRSRIVKILKGDINKLQELYKQKFNLSPHSF